jgi:hypothetical protein
MRDKELSKGCKEEKEENKKSQPENRPAPINPITMKTVAKVTNCSKKENRIEVFCYNTAIRNTYKRESQSEIRPAPINPITMKTSYEISLILMPDFALFCFDNTKIKMRLK